MSRCQHNQKITKFCISSVCNHPNSGGCQYCFKRYHCHIGQTKGITQNEINDIIKYLTSFQDKKVKIRPFKQAIYNYFNIIKGQISTYLDCLSSDLLNKISYPYLKKQGKLNILKKIKHKEFNKLTASELINLVQFKQNNDSQKLQKNQVINYLEQSKDVFKKLQNIHCLYQQIQKQTEDSYLGQSIMSVSIFYKKIIQIYNNIQNQKNNLLTKYQGKHYNLDIINNKLTDNKKNANQNKIENQFSQTIASTKVPPQSLHTFQNQKRKIQVTFQSQQFKPIKNQQVDKDVPQVQKRQVRSRKVSIDSRCNEPALVKSRLRTYQEKQKQITQRKQKLQQLMSKSARKKVNDSESSSQKDKKQQKQLSVATSFVQKDKRSSELGNQSMFAHKLLPQKKQELRLYQEQPSVQKKTLKIPVNVIPQNVEDQQIQSPILKLKKSSKPTTQTSGGFKLGLFKVQPSPQPSTRSQPIQKPAQQKSNTSSQSVSDKQNQIPKLSPPSQKMNLTQKQTNSLILLAQSLKLPAKKAIPLLQASLKYSPHNFSAAQYLSYLYLQQNKPKQCLNVCNQTLKLMPDQIDSIDFSIHLYNNKAAALNLLGRYSQSIPILQKCIENKKKDILYKNLGDSYFNLGIIQKAIINYENATILNDQNHQALYNLAVCLYLQKNYDTSKLKVQRALMLDNTNQNYLQLYKQITGNNINAK